MLNVMLATVVLVASITACSTQEWDSLTSDPAAQPPSTGVAAPSAAPSGTASATASRMPQEPSVAREWSAALAALPEVERLSSTASNYRRDAFGSAWSDIDGNGCNQRDDVLLRDAIAGSTRVGEQGRCKHDVLAGTWRDPYTGGEVTLTNLKERSQAQAIQIDHVVPLAEAWVSGARAWSPERRRTFANDLDGLLAVAGSVNASKGSGDPASWRPKKAFQCAYAVRWVSVKSRWNLGVDRSERAALEQMLGLCPEL